MWGQESLFRNSQKGRRIIPMRVGTSGGLVLAGAYNMDHPHACGDKCSLPLNNRLCSGSSPCVWGQDLQRNPLTHTPRIIPMRVGTSNTVILTPWLQKDHPHACGDKNHTSLSIARHSGSSPCVWGQARQLRGNKAEVGIIPMRVGTSCHRAVKHYQTEDHPHACGDK